MKNLFLFIISFFCVVSFIKAQEDTTESMFDYTHRTVIKKQEKINDSPYAMFGDNTAVLKTRHEERSDHSLKIPLFDNDVQIGLVKLDFQTGIVSVFDIEKKLLKAYQLTSEQLARFLTIDPMAEKYYSISPYVYCANNPLKYTDPNGDTIRVSIYDENNKTINSYYYGTDSSGNYGFIGVDGKLYTGNDKFTNALTSALGILRSKSFGKSLVDDLASSTNTVTISKSNRNIATKDGKGIGWNPNLLTSGPDTNGGNTRDPFIGLGHEMGHIQDTWNGTIDHSTWVTLDDGTSIEWSEIYATDVENRIRSEHGKPIRTHYGAYTNGSGIESTRIVDSVGREYFSRFYSPINMIKRNWPSLPYFMKVPRQY